MADLSGTLQAVIGWLRRGYPNGVPEHDFVPLFALLRRQLTADEIGEVATRLSVTAHSDEAIDRVDTGVAITRITDETPHDDDVARVRTTLEAAGWPFDDEPLDSAAPDRSTPEEDP